MYVLEFARHGDERVFEDVLERIRFLSRASRLGLRHGVTILGWSLEPAYARVLVEGALPSVSRWIRLVQSGHGVDLHHRGRGYVEWAPPVPLPMETAEEGLSILYYMAAHSPWSSAWDALGARAWPGVPDPLAHVPRDRHAAAAAIHAPDPHVPVRSGVSWTVLGQALIAATGRPPNSRNNAVAAHQLAARCGYRVPSIADLTAVTPDAVRKSLRTPERAEVSRALCWIVDPRLDRLRSAASFRRPIRPPTFG